MSGKVLHPLKTAVVTQNLKKLALIFMIFFLSLSKMYNFTEVVTVQIHALMNTFNLPFVHSTVLRLP